MTEASKTAEPKSPKMRERVDGLDQRLASIEQRVDQLPARAAQMIEAFKQEVVGRFEELAKEAAQAEIAALRKDLEAKAMQIEELKQQVAEATERAAEAVAAIASAGGIALSQARALDEAELASIVANDPARRLICIDGSAQLGLRPGEAFDPRSKFATPQQATQFARGGVRFAAAPA